VPTSLDPTPSKADGELEARRAELWTVVLEPDEQRVSMVWGTRCRVGKQPSRLRHVVVSTEDP
jgi:hypothetical protein